MISNATAIFAVAFSYIQLFNSCYIFIEKVLHSFADFVILNLNKTTRGWYKCHAESLRVCV